MAFASLPKVRTGTARAPTGDAAKSAIIRGGVTVPDPWKVVEQYSNRLHAQEIILACLIEALERSRPGTLTTVYELLLASATHAHDRGLRAELERFAKAIRKSQRSRAH
jgi:hypothetical protein